MEGIKATIVEKARELKKVENEFIKYFYETAVPEEKEAQYEWITKLINMSEKACFLRNEILDSFQDSSYVTIMDSSAKKVIQDIRNGSTFRSISFLENLTIASGKAQKDIPANSFINYRQYLRDYKWDELWSEFHSWFDLVDYYHKKAIIGPIISFSDVPNRVVAYFDQIKEAFTFGLDFACIALCRSLIEFSLHHKLSTKRNTNNVIELNSRRDLLVALIDEAFKRKILNETLKNVAHDIRKNGNKILHIDKSGSNKSIDSFKTIIDTVKVIEYLYR